jgi:NTP pyrophosphatase (non-canonical NTP hydrolase)
MIADRDLYDDNAGNGCKKRRHSTLRAAEKREKLLFPGSARVSVDDAPISPGSWPFLGPHRGIMPAHDLQHLRSRLRDFAAERDWDQFHSPKNLCMALSGEVGELLEHFQWLTPQQSAALPVQTLREVELEMADVLLYLVRLADKLDVDLIDAAERKIDLNAKKYPVELVRGSAKKQSSHSD